MIIDIRKIYVEIKNRIIDLTYPPNTLIKEEALAEEYKISRTPVRSVISRLVQRGLLVVKPKKGTYVSPISIKMIDNDTYIGKVKKVEEYSAYATLRVTKEKHKDVLIPFVKSFILDVNLEEKKIIVKYIEGLL